MPIPVQPLEASIVHYSTCVMQTCVASCIVFVRVSRNDVGMRGLGNTLLDHLDGDVWVVNASQT